MASFLLIHGACHGGWCWDRVGKELTGRGHQVAAPDLPSEDPTAGLPEYTSVAMAAAQGLTGGLVVVGHSLGALTASEVAARIPVRRLVFVCGIIGAPGKSLADLAEVDADRDLPLGDDALDFADGLFRFSTAGAARVLFHDCPTSDADEATKKLRFQRSLWNETARFEAWPDTEIVSIYATDDRVVNPNWTRRVSRERLGVDAIPIPGGHSPWLSQPRMLAELLTRDLEI